MNRIFLFMFAFAVVCLWCGVCAAECPCGACDCPPGVCPGCPAAQTLAVQVQPAGRWEWQRVGFIGSGRWTWVYVPATVTVRYGGHR